MSCHFIRKFYCQQDFRLLKILPNEKPALEIEKSMKKEDEIELKKQTELEELITHQIDAAIETNEIDSVLLTTTTKPQTTKFISSIIKYTIFIYIDQLKSSSYVDQAILVYR